MKHANLHPKHLRVGNMKVNQWLLPLSCHLGTTHPRDATCRLLCFILAVGSQNSHTEMLFPSQGRDVISSRKGKLTATHPAAPLLREYPTGRKAKPFLQFLSEQYVGKPCCVAAGALDSSFSAGEDRHTAPATLSYFEPGEKELEGSWSTY